MRTPILAVAIAIVLGQSCATARNHPTRPVMGRVARAEPDGYNVVIGHIASPQPGG